MSQVEGSFFHWCGAPGDLKLLPCLGTAAIGHEIGSAAMLGRDVLVVVGQKDDFVAAVDRAFAAGLLDGKDLPSLGSGAIAVEGPHRLGRPVEVLVGQDLDLVPVAQGRLAVGDLELLPDRAFAAVGVERQR